MSAIAFAIQQKVIFPLAYADALGRVFEEVHNNTISHEGGVWVVRTKDGRRVLGKHKTRDEAEQQLRAIEASKASHYAVDDEGQEGVWRTINGRHVFIREGEDLDSALKRSLGSSENDEDDKRDFEQIRKELHEKLGVSVDVADGVDKKRARDVLLQVELALTSIAESAPFISELYRRGSFGSAMTVYLEKGKTVFNESHQNQAYAFYNSKNNRITIATGLNLDSNMKAPKIGGGTYLVGADFKTVLSHELGHAVSARIALLSSKAGIVVGESLYKSKSKEYWAKGVSRYGSTSARELMAEAFAAYVHPGYGKGKPLPKEIVDVFESAGVKPGTRSYAYSTDSLPAYFAQIDKKLDALEAQSLDELREVLSEARDRLMSQVRRGSVSAKDFRLARLPALRSALRDLLGRAQKQGREDAAEDLQGVKTFHYPGGQDHDQQRHGNRGIGDVTTVPIYHGTVLSVVEQIKREGLRPGSFSEEEGLRKKSVFVTNDLAQAKEFARQAVGSRDGKGTPVILELRIPRKMWKDEFRTDFKIGKAEAKYRPGVLPSKYIIGAVKASGKRVFTTYTDVGIFYTVVLVDEPLVLLVEHSVKTFTKPLSQFAPRQAMKWLRAKEFFITDLIDSQITEAARGVLVNALKNGELAGRTVEKLWLLFEPYVGDPSVLRDGSPLSPHRLETIVRTNTVEAYNHGRMMEYTREEMLPFLTALRYSAILDTRTTPVCQHLHGKLFDPISPDLTDLLPPNHFNCRSIIVPVMIGEKVKQEDFATDADIGRAKELADARFLAQDWDESLHPRHPAGSEQGGEFAPKGGSSAAQAHDQRVQRLREISKLSGTKASVELLDTFDVPPPPLESAYVEAVAGYVYNEYNRLNHELRTSKNLDTANLSDVQKTRLRTLDAAIENSISLQESVTVYRGVAGDFNLKEGDVFEDRGFLSTSASEKLGRVFGDTVFELEIPPGTKFIPIAPYLKSAYKAEAVSSRDGVRLLDNALNHAMDEAELLLARGTKMRIKSVQTSMDGKHSYYKAEMVK